jgi:hypothetical protein
MADSQEQKAGNPPQCSCVGDPFANLPPELRPRPVSTMKGLRKVTCPGCGIVYWTNRPTDLCLECEKKGVRPKEMPTTSGG